MANARGKEVDTTSLSIEQAHLRGWIHRDYISHVHRYNHIVKRVRGPKFKNQHILDVGCGCEAPLPFTLFGNQLTHKGGTGSYTGVDYGKKIHPHQYLLNAAERGTFNAIFHAGFDFAKGQLERETYDYITSFEVLEHVEPYHAFKMLERMAALCHEDTEVILSTPIYSPREGAADNHVNEMSHSLFKSLIEAAGLEVNENYGTFASQTDYKKHMSPAQAEVFTQLRQYYDSNVLATIMAPVMSPTLARNAVWVCQASGVAKRDGVAAIAKAGGFEMHSNSTRLEADLKKILKEVK